MTAEEQNDTGSVHTNFPLPALLSHYGRHLIFNLQTWRFSLRQGLTVLKHESVYFKKGLPAELKCKPTTFGKKHPIGFGGHLVEVQDLSARWPFLLFHSKASWKSQYRETKEQGKSLPKKGH